ncbi:hypothetical protein WJX79_007328 [Trebouxia sp. C0005]
MREGSTPLPSQSGRKRPDVRTFSASRRAASTRQISRLLVVQSLSLPVTPISDQLSNLPRLSRSSLADGLHLRWLIRSSCGLQQRMLSHASTQQKHMISRHGLLCFEQHQAAPGKPRYHEDEYKQGCAEALKTIEVDLMKPTLRSESIDLTDTMQEAGEGLGYQIEMEETRQAGQSSQSDITPARLVDSLKGDISVYELIVDEYAKTQQVSLENDNRSVLPPFNDSACMLPELHTFQ